MEEKNVTNDDGSQSANAPVMESDRRLTEELVSGVSGNVTREAESDSSERKQEHRGRDENHEVRDRGRRKRGSSSDVVDRFEEEGKREDKRPRLSSETANNALSGGTDSSSNAAEQAVQSRAQVEIGAPWCSVTRQQDGQQQSRNFAMGIAAGEDTARYSMGYPLQHHTVPYATGAASIAQSYQHSSAHPPRTNQENSYPESHATQTRDDDIREVSNSTTNQSSASEVSSNQSSLLGHASANPEDSRNSMLQLYSPRTTLPPNALISLGPVLPQQGSRSAVAGLQPASMTQTFPDMNLGVSAGLPLSIRPSEQTWQLLTRAAQPANMLLTLPNQPPGYQAIAPSFLPFVLGQQVNQQQLLAVGDSQLPAASNSHQDQHPQGSQVATSSVESTGTCMYLSCDDDFLSEYQVLVRKQIEFFEATPEDVATNVQGRKKQLHLGQVGLRCIHCSSVQPLRRRGRGSVYFPMKLSGLYQAAQNMATTHLSDSCAAIDPSVKAELRLRELRVTASGGKKYWADSGKAIGLYETENGLRKTRPTRR